MLETLFGIKEIYECVLKPTYTMKIGERVIEAGEPIVVFDSLQVANIVENKNRTPAQGGYNNQTRILWETTENVTMSFSQGVLSKTHLALLGNAAMKENTKVPIFKSEVLEISEDGIVELAYKPMPNSLYVYNGVVKIPSNEYQIKGKRLIFPTSKAFDTVVCCYSFEYKGADNIIVGQRMFNGFLSLSAKVRLKDSVTGKTVTGILEIPKMRLMSDFTIRLGSDVSPAVGVFKIVALPTGSKGNERVAELSILDKDIDEPQ